MPGMLSDSERIAILQYVRNLRWCARDDKLQAERFPHRREHHLAERKRRLKEAWRWRKWEREYRPTAIKALLRSMFAESVQQEAAE